MSIDETVSEKPGSQLPEQVTVMGHMVDPTVLNPKIVAELAVANRGIFTHYSERDTDDRNHTDTDHTEHVDVVYSQGEHSECGPMGGTGYSGGGGPWGDTD